LQYVAYLHPITHQETTLAGLFLADAAWLLLLLLQLGKLLLPLLL